MQELANKLVLHVRNSARASGLPPSVIAHFDSLRRGHITKIGDGTYQVELAFTDDLSRPSLQPSKYRGVDNIIAIFNSGYPTNRSRSEAISHVYGWWNGKYTQALPYRPGLYFMQTAINDFNEVLVQGTTCLRHSTMCIMNNVKEIGVSNLFFNKDGEQHWQTFCYP
jgi:hypothetical protein